MEPGPAVEAVLGDALEVLRIVAILTSPAVPDAAAEIWRRPGLAGSAEGPRPRGWAGWCAPAPTRPDRRRPSAWPPPIPAWCSPRRACTPTTPPTGPRRAGAAPTGAPGRGASA